MSAQDDFNPPIGSAEILAFPSAETSRAPPAKGQGSAREASGSGGKSKPPRGRGKVRDGDEPPDGDDSRILIRRGASSRAREVREAMSALANVPSEFYVCGTKIVRPELVTIAGVDDEVSTAPGLAEASIATIAGALDRRTRWEVFSKRDNDWIGKNSPNSLRKNPGFGFSLMIQFGHESMEAPCAGDFGIKVDCFPTSRQRHGCRRGILCGKSGNSFERC